MRGKPKTKCTRKTLRRKRRQAQAYIKAFLSIGALRAPSTFILTAESPALRRPIATPAPPTSTALSVLARLGLA